MSLTLNGIRNRTKYPKKADNTKIEFFVFLWKRNLIYFHLYPHVAKPIN